MGPVGPVYVRFTTPVKGAEVQRHLKILPAVPVVVDDTADERTYWNLTEASLKPRTGYAVVADTGLRDVFGQRLTGNPVATVATTGYPPSLDYEGGRMLVERTGFHTLAVRHVNLDTLFVAIRPIPDSLYPEFLRRGPWGWTALWDRLDSTAGVRPMAVPHPQDQMMITGIPLPIPDASRAGAPAAWAIRIRGIMLPDRRRDAWQRAPMAVAQVTDLGVTSRAGGVEATVWVTGTGDGLPRRGAEVELHDGRGKLLARGATDTTGLVRFTGVRGLDGEDQDEECVEDCGGRNAGAYVSVRLGADRTLLGVNESSGDLSPWQFNAYRAWGVGKLPVAAAVFTERGIYRPGEKVYAKLIVRNGPLGSLVPPPRGDSAQLVFRDRDGGKFRSTVLRLSPYGTAIDSLTIPAAAKLGTYSVSVMVHRQGSWTSAADASYRIAEYRAPEFLVTTFGDTAARVPGDSFRTTVEARYLFGAPMARAAVRWTARLTPSWFGAWDIPTLGDGWYIGSSGYWWEESESNSAGEPTVLAEGSDTLDAAGRLVVTAPVTAPARGRAGRVTIEAIVTDVNRQSVVSAASAVVHPSAFYVAAKPSGEYFWTGGKPQRIELLAVRPNGQHVAGVAVKGVIIRREWHQVRRDRGGYGETMGQWVEDTVARCAVRTAATPVGCDFTPAEGGSYIARFSATDADGREVVTSFYRWATGRGWVPWNDDSRFKLDIIPDKTRYSPGDTATIMIASPFTNAEAWFTVEREGILEQRRIRIVDGATRIRLPITERHAPNVFVSVVVMRGRSAPQGSLDDPGRPAIRVGYAELRVTPEVKRLQVTVEPAQGEYRPGDSALVRLTTRTTRGGAQSEVTLWAVDEGVLSLTGYRTPDPLDLLYRPRGLGLTLSSGLVNVAPQVLRGESRALKGLTNAGQGGGREGADVLRSRFQTTAFFLGSVVTGADGRGSARVKLPDNLTTFRVMAVALTAGDRYGSGQAPMLVTRPLLARPSLPRFFRPGDDFLAGVVVNQRAGGTPTVTVDATGQGVTFSGSQHQSATLEAGRGKEVRFPVKGLPGDSASFRFDVAGNGDRDAVLTRLPIRPAYHPRATTVAGMLSDTATISMMLPAGLDLERTRIEVATGVTPFAVLRGLDSELRLYDWLCTEQVVSTMTPLLALYRAQQVSGDSLVGNDAKARLTRGVGMLLGRQNEDGSFGLWSSSDNWTSPWLTAYAGAFLADAKRAGFAVSDTVLGRAAGWLSAKLRDLGPVHSPVAYWYHDVQSRLRERVAAADFVSRLGQPDLAAENELVRSASLLGWEDRVRLAQILARRGAVQNARALLEPIWRTVTVEGNRAVIPDSAAHRFYFYSRIRPVARLLQATMAVDSTHPLIGPLVQTLVGRGRAERGWYRWWNTQDAASSAEALAEYARRQRSAVKRGFTVSGGGRTLLTLAPGVIGAERDVNVPTLLTPVGRDSVRLTLRLAAQGPGPSLFYFVTVKDVPQALPVTPDDRGIRVERWYEPIDRRTPIGTVTEGELVRVRLRITVPTERQFVVVDDPLPAGLEAVDLSLATESHGFSGNDCTYGRRGGDDEARGESSGWDWYYGSWDGCWWSPFDHRELRDDRVVWVATVLWKGVYSMSYVARATTAGTFKRAPAWAEEMYNPAVNGRTEGGTFTVRPR
ncbi:MAG: MG2 domain-containing protein [Gemmatimonadales bacterium]